MEMWRSTLRQREVHGAKELGVSAMRAAVRGREGLRGRQWAEFWEGVPVRRVISKGTGVVWKEADRESDLAQPNTQRVQTEGAWNTRGRKCLQRKDGATKAALEKPPVLTGVATGQSWKVCHLSV